MLTVMRRKAVLIPGFMLLTVVIACGGPGTPGDTGTTGGLSTKEPEHPKENTSEYTQTEKSRTIPFSKTHFEIENYNLAGFYEEKHLYKPADYWEVLGELWVQSKFPLFVGQPVWLKLFKEEYPDRKYHMTYENLEWVRVSPETTNHL